MGVQDFLFEYMHVITQDKQPTSRKLSDNRLVMLAIDWATFYGSQTGVY